MSRFCCSDDESHSEELAETRVQAWEDACCFKQLEKCVTKFYPKTVQKQMDVEKYSCGETIDYRSRQVHLEGVTYECCRYHDSIVWFQHKKCERKNERISKMEHE